MSRSAGVASVAWGLIVWVFGEAFGQIFAPGLTWMFGAPGAVLFYCLAGGPGRPARPLVGGAPLGRLVLRAMGLFFVGMAVLQAWPGRGFWQGQAVPGTTPGARSTDGAARWRGRHNPILWFLAGGASPRFDSAHGWAVNLFFVVALAGIGAALLTGRPPARALGPAAAVVLCLADWVLVQDLGFLGGVGTDPNSMVPMALLLVAGYVAVTRPATLTEPVSASAVPVGSARHRGRRPAGGGEKPSTVAGRRRAWAP